MTTLKIIWASKLIKTQTITLNIIWTSKYKSEPSMPIMPLSFLESVMKSGSPKLHEDGHEDEHEDGEDDGEVEGEPSMTAADYDAVAAKVTDASTDASTYLFG